MAVGLGACSGGASGNGATGAASADTTADRVRCDAPHTAAFSDRTTPLGLVSDTNLNLGELADFQNLEEGTSFSVTITAHPPLSDPSAPVAAGRAVLVRAESVSAATCAAVATSVPAADGSPVSTLVAKDLAAGDYRIGVLSSDRNGYFSFHLADVKVPVPIVSFPESGPPTFIDTSGAPVDASKDPSASGYRPGKNIQVRYDVKRLLDRFPECMRHDDLETGDAVAQVFMGVKVDGEDVPDVTVQVGGFADGDGVEPQPSFGDFAVPESARALGVYFFCSDASGNRHFDNNGNPSGGFYDLPRAPGS